jgi:metallo-beta-lactamase family protein
MKIQFLGAAATVTGSKFLLESQGGRILIDCGLFQGRKELRLRNWNAPPFNPKSINAIVLTHAHIDHSGALPLLYRHGFRGDIYCTPATIELAKILLPDSAALQEEEARFANKQGSSKHHPALPLYNIQEANETLKLFKPIELRSKKEITPGLFATAHEAGHILGSASLTIDCQGKRATFSGDIGRPGSPILSDPEVLELGDILICESTYGDRFHEDKDPKKELAEVVNSALSRGGPLLIPSFAVGRVQTLLYYLAELERSGEIPVLPVFVDSPMAVDVTSLYRHFHSEYDSEAAALVADKKNVLRTEQTFFCRETSESKKLNQLTGPRIIISASGMVNGGRILHHMRQYLHREETTVLFVGYQAEGTRGRQILSGAKTVKIFGEDIRIRAAIKSISGFSAHADAGEIIRWLQSCRNTPKSIKLVHGEPPALEALATKLRSIGLRAEPAEDGEVVEI